MNLKDKIITCLLCGIVLCIYLVIGVYNEMHSNPTRIYNVYLNGEVIGAISDKDALYNLIDEKQQTIKDKYNVSNVYPPSSLQVVENYTYTPEISDLEEVYNKIEKMQDFTIYGYEVKISDGNKKSFNIYILDKDIFNEALQEFVLAFIDEEAYNNYLNGTQVQSDDLGITYEDMKILEDITIREKYISINDKIYENREELAQELLFGFNYKERSYTVKEGDTIESISEANTLNTQEFLIANPQYSSKDSLLTIGDKVNITLINPEISFSYNIRAVEQVEIPYEPKTVRDNTKDPGYSEITQPGVTGIEIQTSRYNVVNGEQNSKVEIVGENVIVRAKVDQITTRGRQEAAWGWEKFEETGTGWGWPTQQPFAVTSEFAPRWGKYHNGMDISGPGMGSKIYAANDGVITHVTTGCPDNGIYGSNCGGGYGNYVVISHGNNIYTLYGHMTNNVPVKVGQTVTKGTVVGYMGNSGSSQGTHLHFGLSIGDPNKGGTWRNARELYK